MAPVKEVDVERVQEALEPFDSVLSAYLFGSHARGDPGPLSDVDVGVLLDPDLPPDERFDLRLRLIGEVSSTLGRDDLDLVVLNDVPPRLAYECLKGHRFLLRDRQQVVAFEARTTSRVLDRAFYDRRHDRVYLERATG